MLAFGSICEIDLDKGLAKVNFEEEGFVSGWLKMGVMRAGADSFIFPYDINEHVYCQMDENFEYGVVCGAVYDEGNKPEGAQKGIIRLKFRDNSTLEYDGNSHTLSLDIKGDISVKCEKADITANEVEITATTTKLNGLLEVSGAAIIQGMVSVGGLGSATPGVPIPTEAGTELNIQKISAETITASNDVTAGTVSLKSHKHTAPSGGGLTTPPI